MPRRNGRKRNNRRRSRASGSPMSAGVDRTVTIPGRCLLTLTPGPTVNYNVLDVTPYNFDSRLLTFTSAFQFFRFKSISIRLLPNSVTTTGVAYSKRIGPSVGSLTTADALYQLDASRLLVADCTVPITLNLRNRDLQHGARTWYVTNPTFASDPLDASQGSLVSFVQVAGTPVDVEVSYVCQFRGPDSHDAQLFSKLSIKDDQEKEFVDVKPSQTRVCSCKH